MLRLVVDNAARADAVLPVGWCLDHDDRQRLVDKKVKEPFILLVIVHADGHEERHLRPLVGDQIEYISFSHPGRHHIHATVVWCLKGEGELRQVVLQHENPTTYRRKVIDRGTDQFKPEWLRGEYVDTGVNQLGSVSQEVDVGPEFFAPPPPKWQEAWVRLIITSKPPHQCSFRRRLWFWSPIQVLILPIVLFVKYSMRIFFAAVAALAGQRDISLSPFLHPFSQDAEDVSSWRGADNFFFTDKHGEKRASYWWGLWPISWLLLAIAGLFLHSVLGLGVSAWKSVFYFALTTIIGFELYLLLAGLTDKLGYLPSRDELEATKENKKQLREECEKGALARQFSVLACSSAESVDDLRANRKPSLRLRYLDLKHRLCKQYAS